MKVKKPAIGVTFGDAAGIGPEIIAMVARKGYLHRYARPVLIGDERVLKRGMRDTGSLFEYEVVEDIEAALACERLPLLDTRGIDGMAIELGTVTAENGKEEGDNLVRCIEYCQSGHLDGFCFTPLNKSALKAGGYNYPSEHEMFADIYGIRSHFGEMNVLKNLWNIRVTSHIPLSEVSSRITIEKILDSVELGYSTLLRAGKNDPRIAVAALNPHSGENGTCGREEIDIIKPAIAEAAKMGIILDGPFSSDILFLKAFNGGYDGVVTMYHDQGQIAIKLKGFMHCVTVSAGLPHAITTPAHGTAYDIVGSGECSTASFEDAYRICCRMAAHDRSVRA